VGKDKSKKSEITGSASKLAHNPFAQLKGRLELPENPTSETPPTPPMPVPVPAKLGRLVQRRETKHRGGKAVIVVSGFGALSSFDRDAVEALARELKAKLGCGGTVEDDASGPTIVIQGEQARKLAELLRAKGFRVDGVVT
jgi:translation initiation factor 1 (eIF-1/SUI1)